MSSYYLFQNTAHSPLVFVALPPPLVPSAHESLICCTDLVYLYIVTVIQHIYSYTVSIYSHAATNAVYLTVHLQRTSRYPLDTA